MVQSSTYMDDNVSEEYYSIKMILNSLDEFLKIAIFDFLIGNLEKANLMSQVFLREGE